MLEFKSPEAAHRFLVANGYPKAKLILTDEPMAEDDEIELGGGAGIQIHVESVCLSFSGTFHEYDAAGELVSVSHGFPTHAVLIAARNAITMAALHRHQGKATDIEGLTAEYQAWVEGQGLPQLSADELIYEELTDEQRRYVSDFILRWEAAEEEEDA